MPRLTKAKPKHTLHVGKKQKKMEAKKKREKLKERKSFALSWSDGACLKTTTELPSRLLLRRDSLGKRTRLSLSASKHTFPAAEATAVGTIGKRAWNRRATVQAGRHAGHPSASLLPWGKVPRLSTTRTHTGTRVCAQSVNNKSLSFASQPLRKMQPHWEAWKLSLKFSVVFSSLIRELHDCAPLMYSSASSVSVCQRSRCRTQAATNQLFLSSFAGENTDESLRQALFCSFQWKSLASLTVYRALQGLASC